MQTGTPPREDCCIMEAWAGVGVRGGIRKKQQAAAGCSKLRGETESRQLLAEKRKLRRELRTCREGEKAEREGK